VKLDACFVPLLSLITFVFSNKNPVELLLRSGVCVSGVSVDGGGVCVSGVSVDGGGVCVSGVSVDGGGVCVS
jgi:hypothetical protein